MSEQTLLEAVTAELRRLGQAENVRVSAADGVVTLRGRVADDEQRTIIAQEVLRLRNVAKVRNELEVPLPAGELRDQLESLLARAGARISDMVIDATGDEVTIRGKAEGWFDRDAAGRLAWTLPGVRRVVNEVVIPPDAVDPELEPGVRDAP